VLAAPVDDTEVLPRAARAWADEPTEFAWERWLGIGILVACVVLVFVVSDAGQRIWRFWDPQFGDLFKNTTTNGGDMGAHVWWPWFMREHWFFRFRLAGWAPDWYAGFPVGQFYFPLPALLITFLDFFIPYNIAFKLITVSGPLLLPVGAYAFARALRARWPMPPAFAVAATVFLFNTRESWQIYGGNLASNLAGEFSYTLAIALCLFFFAALARTLDTGKRVWLPTLLLALTALCHIVVITFAIVGGLLVWLTRRPLRTFPVAGVIGVVGGLLAAVWWAPLLLRQPYTQSMRYEKVVPQGTAVLWAPLRWALPGPIESAVTGVWRGITWSDGKSLTLWAPTWMWILVGIAIVGGIAFRRVPTLVLVLLTAIFAVMFVQWPADQHVWNTRFLPLYFLSLSLLAGAGAAEIANLARLIAVRAADWVHEGDLADARDDALADARDHDPHLSDLPGDWTPPPWLHHEHLDRRRRVIGAIACALVVGIGTIWGIGGAYAARNYLPFWSSWNYSGYESKPAWPEFQSLIETMDKLPPGRALWEPSSGIDNYGTTLALELLPYFTNGRIGSMEGLYFESSATTDYHFLTVSELTASGNASNPVRGLSYGTIDDFDRGVQHLQMLGVRYFLAQSEDAKRHADANRDLRLVATVPDRDGKDPKGWSVYEVQHSALVEGLAREPVVAKVHSGTSSSCFGTAPPAPPAHDPGFPNAWECATAPWWMNGALLSTPYAETGPKNWRRVDIKDLGSVQPRTLPEVEVSNVKTDVDEIRFHVSRTGVPVVVKSSFFPNWTASGAHGPWRLAPNLMVVVPTKHDVVLSYGVSGVDWLGRVLTVLGIVGLVLLVRWRPGPSRVARDEPATDEPPSAGDGGDGSDGDDHGDGAPGDDADEHDEAGTERSSPTPALP
jgi:6-pyruvoyl-tetrahydropterin synthase-like protein